MAAYFITRHRHGRRQDVVYRLAGAGLGGARIQRRRLKPIATGDREDALRLQAAMGSAQLTLDEINPAYFAKAASPLAAARAENRRLDFTALNAGIRATQARFSHTRPSKAWAAGALPLANNYSVREWARELGLPVVVVARGTLGTLNHTRC